MTSHGSVADKKLPARGGSGYGSSPLETMKYKWQVIFTRITIIIIFVITIDTV